MLRVSTKNLRRFAKQIYKKPETFREANLQKIRDVSRSKSTKNLRRFAKQIYKKPETFREANLQKT